MTAPPLHNGTSPTQRPASAETPAVRPIEDAYPLTRIQQALLVRCIAYPEQGLYTGQWWAILDGKLDEPLFCEAWQEVVNRHSALRSGFHWEIKDHPFQVVHRLAALPIVRHDRTDAADWRGQLDALLAEDRNQGFDIRKPPLMRLTLIRLPADRHCIIWTRHHLTVDGWSLGILLDEVFVIYKALLDGRDHGLLPAPAFRTYADWESSRDGEPARRHWQAALQAGSDTDQEWIPLAQARGEPDIRLVSQELSATDTASLVEFARSAQLTVSTLIHVAWAVVNSRLLNRNTVLFGSVETIRPPHLESSASAHLVGIQIQTQPVLAHLDETPLQTWALALQTQTAQARAAGPISLDELGAAMGLPSGTLPFDSLLAYQNYPLDEAGALTGSGLRMLESGDTTVPDMPLNLMIERRAEGGLHLQLMHDLRHYAKADAALRLDMLAHALAVLPGQANIPVAQLDILPPTLRDTLQKGGYTPLIQEQPASVLHAVLEHAAGQPYAPAVVYGEQRLSYGDLLAWARAISVQLEVHGVQPGTRVGLHLERTPQALAAILGIMLRGASYVPLDVNAPEDRKTFMAAQAGLGAILSATPEAVGGMTPLAAEAGPPATAPSPIAAIPGNRPEDEAYVIFTSGSTGKPKGVAVAHGNLSYHVAARNQAHPGRPNRILLLTFPLIFDGSVTGIFGTLATGGTLVLPQPIEASDPDRLARLIARENVSQTIMIPSQWNLMLSSAAGSDLKQLELAIVAGEACPRELVERHHAQLPGTQLCNEYGPTEATVWATLESCSPGETGPVSIGRPIPGTCAYVADTRGRLCPPGAVGELLVAGPGIASGYVGRPDLTAERFLANPYDDTGRCARMYRTGDQVTLGFDGKLHFQGRADDQVKISGYRIELEEISACLLQAPGVSDAVAVVHHAHPQAQPQIVGHVAGSALPSTQAVLRHIQERLPAYMVPHSIVLHERLPRGASGKLDRKALPAPVQQAGTSAPPEGEVEQRIAQVWQSVLERSNIGRHDDFFALGGKSLDAMQVVSRLRREMNLAVELVDLFEAPRLADLARRLRSPRGDAAPAIRKRQRVRVDLGAAPARDTQ
ncbi:amino acid adenylation domain-containing protein [Pusillimonas sp. MFBS29]|uniref:non-ribosomal peptide synthetase n=1 Tax=Pusillimonas sp. MFBS29 TaxID=2886690 RepID=UPI001D11C050|nr:non-ribosomal peptide synthetase [Pusillimonas sp. MFBS29]MCC2597577.1 amino acid adenylation domain-containing protein [Pusillimonas sp. MFBS29]